MKKLISIVFIISFILTSTISAINIGDYIGEVVYTDIAAYINNYPIPCFVIDGEVVVVAQDLSDYGCKVLFDSNANALYITKARDQARFSERKVYAEEHSTGEFYAGIRHSDIKTYVNGTYVKSYNVNYFTMISLIDFGKCMGNYTWDGTNRIAQAWIDGFECADFKPLERRTQVTTTTLFSNCDPNLEYSGWHDMNYDGIAEHIALSINENINYPGGMPVELTIGDKTIGFMTQYFVTAVLITDIDISDGVKDVVTFSCLEGGLLDMRIIRSDNASSYNFQSESIREFTGGRSNLGSVVFLGEVMVPSNVEALFKTTGNKTFEVFTRYNSSGAWNIKTTFKETYDGSGYYTEATVPYYEVCSEEFMKDRYLITPLTGWEKEQWDNGYIKAYISYIGDGIRINAGDYFKVVYDNGNNYVYITTESGSSGWIYIGNYAQREALNRNFFYMVG